MANEITFRIYTGNKYVDIKILTEGVSLEKLLEIEEGEHLENSVYLREPDSFPRRRKSYPDYY